LIDLTLQQSVLRFFAMLLIIGVHGLTVAGTACALGDPGPRHDGRLSASPLAHLDLLGLASGVFFAVGWIKPVAIDAKVLRVARSALVVVAPAIAVVVLIVALRLTRPFLLPLLNDMWSMLVFALIETIGQIGIWFALLNLLPVPPFTGSLLTAALVPAWRDIPRRAHIYAAVVAMGIALTGIITRVLEPVHRMIAQLILSD
jgi:Zn-dependent protease